MTTLSNQRRMLATGGDRRRPIRTVALGRIAVFLVGALSVGGVVACSDDDTSEPPAAVTAAIEAFTDAVNSYDSEALLAVTSEDFTWESTGTLQSREEFVEFFEANYEVGNFNIEPTGQLTLEADGDAYVAEEPGRVTSLSYNEEGLTTYRVVEVDGTWLVQELRWEEDGADG